MVSRASRRLYILCSLKRNGVDRSDLLFIYLMYIRPLLEFASPVWSSSLTSKQSDDLERVQRRALRFISYPQQQHYSDLLCELNITTLSDRRNTLLTNFGKSLLLSARHRDMLPPERYRLIERNLRNASHLDIPKTRTKRYQKSTIPSLVRILNSQ